jgi:hypothetical protein
MPLFSLHPSLNFASFSLSFASSIYFLSCAITISASIFMTHLLHSAYQAQLYFNFVSLKAILLLFIIIPTQLYFKFLLISRIYFLKIQITLCIFIIAPSFMFIPLLIIIFPNKLAHLLLY